MKNHFYPFIFVSIKQCNIYIYISSHFSKFEIHIFCLRRKRVRNFEKIYKRFNNEQNTTDKNLGQ